MLRPVWYEGKQADALPDDDTDSGSRPNRHTGEQRRQQRDLECQKWDEDWKNSPEYNGTAPNSEGRVINGNHWVTDCFEFKLNDGEGPKFIDRFEKTEDLIRCEGKDMKALDIDTLDSYWRSVKNEEKQ